MRHTREELKRWADRLTDEDAVIALNLIRALARQRRNRLREQEDREDLADARAAREEARTMGTIPWDQVKARHGL